MEWGLSRAETLRISQWRNGAELCNMADFSKLPVKHGLVQLVLRNFFTTNWILYKEKDYFMMILFCIGQENMRKKDFDEPVCKANSGPYMCWFSMKLKIIGKILLCCFLYKWPFLFSS